MLDFLYKKINNIIKYKWVDVVAEQLKMPF